MKVGARGGGCQTGAGSRQQARFQSCCYQLCLCAERRVQAHACAVHAVHDKAEALHRIWQRDLEHAFAGLVTVDKTALESHDAVSNDGPNVPDRTHTALQLKYRRRGTVQGRNTAGETVCDADGIGLHRCPFDQRRGSLRNQWAPKLATSSETRSRGAGGCEPELAAIARKRAMEIGPHAARHPTTMLPDTPPARHLLLTCIPCCCNTTTGAPHEAAPGGMPTKDTSQNHAKNVLPNCALRGGCTSFRPIVSTPAAMTVSMPANTCPTAASASRAKLASRPSNMQPRGWRSGRRGTKSGGDGQGARERGDCQEP